MKSRIRALEARRRLLLERCAEQRLELEYRLAQLRPATQLASWARGQSGRPSLNPLAWVAGIAGLVLLLRRRRLLSGVGWLTGVLALATRATSLLRLFAQLRAIYRTLQATRRASAQSH